MMVPFSEAKARFKAEKDTVMAFRSGPMEGNMKGTGAIIRERAEAS
jgi:hypothetical protein